MAIAVGGAGAGAACAQSIGYIGQDRTFDTVNYGTAYHVGWDNVGDANQGINPKSPTVTVLPTAEFPNGMSFYLYHGSTINRAGSTANVTLYDESVASVSGGTGGISAWETSTVTMSGGTPVSIGGGDDATFTVTGGEVRVMSDFYGTSTVNVSGGTLGTNGWDLRLNDQATANLSGGSVVRDLVAIEQGVIAVTGFAVGRNVVLRSNGSIGGSGLQVGQHLLADGRESAAGGPAGRVTVGLSAGGVGGNMVLTRADAVLGGVTIAGTAGVTQSTLSMTGGRAELFVIAGSTVSLNGVAVPGSISATGTASEPAALSMQGGSAGSVDASGAIDVAIGSASVAGDVTIMRDWGGRAGLVGIDGVTVGGQLTVYGDAAIAVEGTVVVGSGSLGNSGDLRVRNTTFGGSHAGFSGSGGVCVIDGVDSGGSLYVGRSAGLNDVTAVGDVLFSGGSTSTATNLKVGGNLGVDGSLTLEAGEVALDAWIGAPEFLFQSGRIAGSAELFGEGHMTMGAAASVGGDVKMSGWSVAVVAGGTVDGDVSVADEATMTLSAGAVGGFALQGGRTYMTGGTAGDIGAGGTAEAEVSGGTVTGNLVAIDNARVTWNGGKLTGFATVRHTAELYLFGGTIGGKVDLREQAVFQMEGAGMVEGNLEATGTGDEDFQTPRISLTSGMVKGNVELFDTRKMEMTGAQVVGHVRTNGPGNELRIDGPSVVGGGVSVNQGGKAFVGKNATINEGLIVSGTAEVNVTEATVMGAIDVLDGATLRSDEAVLGGPIVAYHGAKLHLENSSVGDVTLTGADNELEFRGGTVETLTVGRGFATIREGTVWQLVVEERGRGEMRGGLVEGLFRVGGEGRFRLQGGVVDDEARVAGNADLEIDGGRVTGNLHASGTSGTVMYRGVIGGNLRVEDRAELWLYGGRIEGTQIVAAGDGKIYLGSFGLEDEGDEAGVGGEAMAVAAVVGMPELVAEGNGVITIHGTELGAMLVDGGYEGGAYSLYRLAGVLMDGTRVDGGTMRIRNGTAAGYELRALVPGDADLDGVADGDDYALIDRGMAMGLAGWLNGDFDRDGGVDGADYLILDTAYYGRFGGVPAGVLGLREREFGEGYVRALVAAVPEPGILGLAGIGGLVVGRRRRGGSWSGGA